MEGDGVPGWWSEGDPWRGNRVVLGGGFQCTPEAGQGLGSHRTSERVGVEGSSTRLRGERRKEGLSRSLTPNHEAALSSRRGAGGAARRRLGMAGEL